MRIGILTYHDGINHGAFLQVFSSYTELRKMGFNVEVINYKSLKHWFWEYKCFLYTKHIKLLTANVKKILKFKKCQKIMNTSKFTFKNSSVPEYDVLFIGSDEIWNFSVFGINPIYWGKGIKAKKIISYAASFGSLGEKTVLSDEIRILSNNFDNISVRDNNSLKILKNNLPDKPVVKVLDPTFLHDFSGEDKTCKYDNFVLLYTAGMDEAYFKKIYEYAHSIGKKLIAIGYKCNYCDHNIIDIDPFEWLGYFKQADMVITTMFHGTVFSIKYNKEFCVILEPYRVNKIKDMLFELKLDNRILNDNDKDFDKVFLKKIDYELVNKKIEDMVIESRNYIAESLRV